MNHIFFLFLESLIILPFLAGFYLKKKLQLNQTEKKQLSERMIKINLLFFEPIIIIWFIGKLKYSPTTFYLPFSGLFLVFLGFLVGYLFSYNLSPRNRITIVVNTSLANHGYTMGGIICYFLLGEEGLSKALIFISYFYLYLYGFIFPWIRWKLPSNYKNQTYLSLKQKLLDYRLFPLYGLMIALILFIFQIPLPENQFLSFMVQTIVYISIVIYYLALGINLELKKLFYWNKPILFVLGIKFIVVPLITLIVLWLIPSEFLSLFDKKIVLIMSFMPGAVYSIVSSIIFNLNTRFSVQIFVLSTLIFLAMILPILYLTLT